MLQVAQCNIDQNPKGGLPIVVESINNGLLFVPALEEVNGHGLPSALGDILEAQQK